MGLRSNIPSAPATLVNAGVTATAGEINYTDITAAGTAEASKALVTDESIDIAGINDLGVDNDVAVGNDLAVTGAATIGETLAVTGALTQTGAAGFTGLATFAKAMFTPVARTATADGATTGAIAAAGSYQAIAVTSAGANNIITLPTPTPGTVIDLYVGANGYELRSSAPETVLIGGGAGGAAVESAIPANSWAHLVCVDATHWVGYTITGATLAVVEAAA